MAAASVASTPLAKAASRPIERVATAPKQREGAGFVVRRPIGGALPFIDPFLMLDHFGPTTYAPGEAVGAPDHPHRGQETVTYMLQGEFEHKDSWGNEGRLGPGWVQWMTAGSGLVHSETPSAKVMKEGGTVEGFQLWVNLPAKDKFVEPRYQDTAAERIPVVAIPGASEGSTVKVITGESCGASAVIDTKTPISYLDVKLASAGDTLRQEFPKTYSVLVYVFRESLLLGDGEAVVKTGQVAEFGEVEEEGGTAVVLKAPEGIKEPVRALIIAGEPIKEPVVQYGPFVMNTREQIMDAIRDFQAGRMGRISGERERMKEAEEARAAQKKSGRWAKESSEL